MLLFCCVFLFFFFLSLFISFSRERKEANCTHRSEKERSDIYLSGQTWGGGKRATISERSRQKKEEEEEEEKKGLSLCASSNCEVLNFESIYTRVCVCVCGLRRF